MGTIFNGDHSNQREKLTREGVSTVVRSRKKATGGWTTSPPGGWVRYEEGMIETLKRVVSGGSPGCRLSLGKTPRPTKKKNLKKAPEKVTSAWLNALSLAPGKSTGSHTEKHKVWPPSPESKANIERGKSEYYLTLTTKGIQNGTLKNSDRLGRELALQTYQVLQTPSESNHGEKCHLVEGGAQSTGAFLSSRGENWGGKYYWEDFPQKEGTQGHQDQCDENGESVCLWEIGRPVLTSNLRRRVGVMFQQQTIETTKSEIKEP